MNRQQKRSQERIRQKLDLKEMQKLGLILPHPESKPRWKKFLKDLSKKLTK
jgi:hypothetical protein